MGEINKTNTYTEFYYHFFRNILLASVPLVVISAIVLSSLHSYATDSGSGTDSLTISISSACTLSSVVNTEHSDNVKAGTYKDDIGKTTIKTTCNDNNGYSIYTNGYTNNEEGNNRLLNTSSPSNAIETGLNTSGDTSAWAMKLNNIPDDPSPTPPVIESAYDNTYGLIPSNWTKVLSLSSGTTDMSLGSSFTTTYAVYANSRQYTGTYQGQVKYLLTHPATDAKYFFMQDIANWKDQMLPHEGDSIRAVDQRDGKAYWVTKLADGHIWMTQNLDFDIVADEQNSTVMKTLTSEDTDLTDHSLTGAYSQANGYSYDENTGIISWTPSNTAKTINFEGTTVTDWNRNNTVPYSASKTDGTGTGHASLGNYYNWTAAIASNNSNTLTSDTKNNISQNPKNSICPKGWRLPTISDDPASMIDSTNEFARLNYLYNNDLTDTDDGLVSSPLYLTKTGYIYTGLESINEGRLWSSTVVSLSIAYHLRFTSTQVEYARVGSGSVRGSGAAIRCVAR